MYIEKDGGATNRGGSNYVYGASGTAIGAKTVLVPWEASQGSDSYILEFGNGFIRFIKDGALVTVSGVTAWNSGTAYVIGDLASLAGVNYYCILAHTNHTPANATYWYPLVGSVYSIPTPYTSAGTGIFSLSRLKYRQDQKKMILSLPVGNVSPYKSIFTLVRTANTTWVLTDWNSGLAFFGLPQVNAPTNLASDTTGTSTAAWAVTAVTTDGEESLPTSSVFGTAGTSGSPNTLTWTASTFNSTVNGTQVLKGYNVYRNIQGLLYFQAFVTTNTYIDSGVSIPTVDAQGAPEKRADLAFDFPPTAIGAYQQRGLYGDFVNGTLGGAFYPDDVIASKIGFDRNAVTRFPTQDDDSFKFKCRGKGINSIKAFADIGPLVIFTEGGEFVVGAAGQAFTPTAAAPKQYSYNGSGELPPIIIGTEALYVQAQGSIVRSVSFDSLGGGADGYKDTDFTVLAGHLFKGHTILAWAFQKTPDSILWVVRDDGVMLGLTYIKEQNVLAWHRHDTSGIIENVCSIPEGTSYGTYIIVKRTINGSSVRYMERLCDRIIDDIVDNIFMDCALSYDGRNTGVTTMTLSGSGWTYDDTLTLTASASYFVIGDIGNEIHLTGTDGLKYRCVITAYTSVTVVSVKPTETITVASGLRAVATTHWAKAVNVVSGLSHLEAKEVSVLGDGYVVASPNNDEYGTALTVASGSLTLPSCYAVIHVGLPYISDLETLDIDSANGETLTGKKKNISKVHLHLDETRGVWVGGQAPSDDDTDPQEGLVELKIRENETASEPNDLFTGPEEVIIESAWNSNGRVFIRQIDPLPISVLAAMPEGLIPYKQGGG